MDEQYMACASRIPIRLVLLQQQGECQVNDGAEWVDFSFIALILKGNGF